jgi:hypothetical protein
MTDFTTLQVSAWMAGGGDKNRHTDDDMLKLEPGAVDRTLLHYELRRRFPDRVWTFDDDEGRFADPHSFHPDPAFFRLNTNTDPGL